MGTSDLRKAAVAALEGTGCSVERVLLHYVHIGGKQMQVLTVQGRRPNGEPFETVTDPHSMAVEPNQHLADHLEKNFKP